MGWNWTFDEMDSNQIEVNFIKHENIIDFNGSMDYYENESDSSNFIKNRENDLHSKLREF